MTPTTTLLADAERPAGRPFLLLVDDHEPSLRGLCQVVRLAGHACLSAKSAGEALALCESRRPLAVVTDLAMPGLDGGGLARRLNDLYPGVPIVLVTGHDLDDPALTSTRAMFADVLHKPIDPARLLAVLERVVNHP